jgi:hypothetical protein
VAPVWSIPEFKYLPPVHLPSDIHFKVASHRSQECLFTLMKLGGISAYCRDLADRR